MGTATSGTEQPDADAAERTAHWGDDQWWQNQIDHAITRTDPTLSNLRITLVHRELSFALRRITGAESGANFHTWAVWGSKKAGRTIRREDLPWLPRAGWGLGPLVGMGAATRGSRRNGLPRLGYPVSAGAATGVAWNRSADFFLNRAATRIFAGNVTVLDDIGRETARFVAAFSEPESRNEDALAGFLAGLRPGQVRSGGQDLLRGAYRHYLQAGREADRDRRDEQMLYANLLAILHEHERLEPYLDASIPRPLRRFVTGHLLGFAVGDEAMRVSGDVSRGRATAFPETLRTIETPELDAFLRHWDKTPNTPRGSAAHDWTKLADRMNFIVDLFRTRQTDPNLFAPPYSATQRKAITGGRVPPGPL